MLADDPTDSRSRFRSVDVAQYLGVTHQRIAQMVNEGKLPAPRLDPFGRASWQQGVIERWAERHWWGTRPWRKRQGNAPSTSRR
jgi:hypothetical protein